MPLTQAPERHSLLATQGPELGTHAIFSPGAHNKPPVVSTHSMPQGQSAVALQSSVQKPAPPSRLTHSPLTHSLLVSQGPPVSTVGGPLPPWSRKQPPPPPEMP
jgi:hypothetical protein